MSLRITPRSPLHHPASRRTTHPVRRALALLAVTALGACTGTEPTAPVFPRASVAALRAWELRPEEALLNELHARVPSAGGFYVNQTGQVIVLLKNRGEAGSSRAAIAEFASDGRLHTRDGRSRMPVVTVADAQFTFGELARARDRLYQSPAEVDGLVLLDLDEARNRVVLGILPERLDAARANLGTVLTRLGVAPEMVITEAARPPVPERAAASVSMVPGTLLDHADPVVAGILISGPAGGCTLGAIADRQGTRGFVTAGHCSTIWAQTDWSTMDQGSRTIGQETFDPEPWTCDWFGECRGSDATFYSMFGGVNSERGLIARPVPGTLNWDQSNPYFIVQVEMASQVTGESVHKVGITTGWTSGVVTRTCVDLVAGTWPNQWHITCMNEGNYLSDPGDSGSPVFKRREGNLVTWAGVHHGRNPDNNAYRWYSVSWRIQGGGDLGELDIARGATLTRPTLGGYVSSQWPVVTWPAVPGATRYHLYRSWYRYATGEGDADPIYIGAVNSPFLDDLPVSQYTGGTHPGPKAPGFVRYYLIAESPTEYSTTSNIIYFRLAY